MSGILDLARDDLVGMRPYTPGAYEPGMIRLNANESPWRLPADKTERGLNIYPPPRPDVVRELLATHYKVPAEQILVSRGSSEAIDALIRGFCVAGRDAIVTTPPTFDMYRLYAGIQNAAVHAVPLQRDNDFSVDVQGILDAIQNNTKIVFLCSPNNPTGTSIPRDQVDQICTAAAGKSIVVIDEAYREYSGNEDFLEFRQRYEHVVLLRTLSKFVALAGVRCGALIGDPQLVEFLGNVLPPYTFPTPSIEHVVRAFTSEALIASTERIQVIKRERDRLADAMRDSLLVSKVYSSDANFVLLQTRSGKDFADRAKRANILVRQFPGQDGLENCVRVTIGRPEQNDELIRAICGGESR